MGRRDTVACMLTHTSNLAPSLAQRIEAPPSQDSKTKVNARDHELELRYPQQRLNCSHIELARAKLDAPRSWAKRRVGPDGHVQLGQETNKLSPSAALSETRAYFAPMETTEEQNPPAPLGRQAVKRSRARLLSCIPVMKVSLLRVL